MNMRWLCSILCLVFVLSVGVQGADKRFSWTSAPASGEYVEVRLNPYRLGKYFAECEVNRPDIVDEVIKSFNEGKYYRKKTTDQKGKPVRLTVNVTPDYMLRIVTTRNDTCKLCGGTGRKDMPFDKITGNVGVAIKCHGCKGEGFLEDNTVEKYYILSSEDFENPKEGRRILKNKAFSGAPSETEDWIERLVSKNPKERLAACEWLDQNYVRVGAQFQNIMPMIRKARWEEVNEKKRIMVWQFRAGLDIPSERNRAFYRIYANTKTGKITKKGFFAAQ